jgi:pimeloyl-ACP methyl ester carboxylesterase
VSLHFTTHGEQGSRVVLCHGLFGQGRNWTQHAKALSADHRVTLVDIPNHGRSPWTERWDFLEAADSVAELLSADDPVALVGHSLGGKIAMVTALRHPELVERLCVVDVAPVRYDSGREFAGYMDAMLAVDLDALESRQQADALLMDAVPNTTVRGFLLQNLRSDADGWQWQPNLRLLRADLDLLGDWPAAELADLAPYDGRVLWVGGAKSDYIADAYAPAMEALFPRARRVTVKDAGHWVHSEQPAVFGEIIRRFVG